MSQKQPQQAKKRPAPSPQQQRDLIKQCLEQDSALHISDMFFVIATGWLKRWKAHVGYDGEATPPSPMNESGGGDGDGGVEEKNKNGGEEAAAGPGPIDNTCLLKDREFKTKGNDPVLSIKLAEGTDFVLLPHSAWTHLHKWYGGGPPLPREVIVDGKSSALQVELYPLALTFRNTNTEGQINPFSIIEVLVSKKSTVSYLKSLVCKKMDLDVAHTRIWSFVKTSGRLIRDEKVTLEEAKLMNGQAMLVEVRLDDGSWPRDRTNKKRKTSVKEKLLEGRRGGSHMLHSTLNNMKALLGIADEHRVPKYVMQHGSGGSGGSGSYSMASSDIKAKPGTCHGVCGLVNLGNTCFLNSAIQCLSNTAPLTQFFLSNAFKRDINKSNPLGMKGQLADCYGALLKRMWSGEYAAVAPRSLKRCIGKYAPQFNGFSQHDAQEFLAFLLDGLHEDLNRVLDKPYVEIKESDGHADEDVSKEAWESHLKRNRSIIVDLFQGQLKSTVMCPEAKCGKVSITFDPFMYISLPMPPESDRLVEVILFRVDPVKKPVVYSIKCAKTARVQFLKQKLEEYSGIKKSSITMVDVEESIQGFISDTRSVSTFRSNATAFAFETMGNLNPKQAMRIQVLHRRVNPAFVKSADPSVNPRKVPRHTFGRPMLLHVSPKLTTGRQLYTLVWHQISRFMKQDITVPCHYENGSAAPLAKQGSEESGAESNGSSPHQKRTSEDGPHPMAKDSKEGGSDNDKESNGTKSEGETKQKPGQKADEKENEMEEEEEEEEGNGKGKGKVEDDTEKGDSTAKKRDNGKARAHSNSSSVEDSAPNGIEERPKSPKEKGGGAQQTKHHYASRHNYYSSSSYSAESVEPYVPFDWPPQLDFTLDWEKLPFRLSSVSQNGSYCGKCSYSSSCTGCPIKPDDEPVKFKQVPLPTISVDWDPKLVREFLSIEKAEELENHESVAANKKRSKKRLRLDDCFKLFCMNEQLSENDQWYCPKCKDFRQARKQFELWKMPQTLVIHLKRFQYTKFSRDKIITFCDFPLMGLDLSEYIQGHAQNAIYDLYAVANHQGGLGGGHYTAFALNSEDNKWYHFNDGSVTAVSEDAVRTSAAYVLFYKMREDEEVESKENEDLRVAMKGGEKHARSKNKTASDAPHSQDQDEDDIGKEKRESRTLSSETESASDDQQPTESKRSSGSEKDKKKGRGKKTKTSSRSNGGGSTVVNEGDGSESPKKQEKGGA